MYESYLQLRIEETHAEMLREAAAWRLAREARDSHASPTLVSRLRRALASRRVVQWTVDTASATRRTPSSISEAVTCP
jgi:hypothetical protein